MPDEPIAPVAAPEPAPPAADPIPAPAPAADPPAVTPLAPDPPPAAPPADPATSFHSVIGPNGEFLDGWKDKLPEELRHEQSLDAIADVPGAIKQLIHSQKMIGKEKIAIPGENAQPEEIDAFQIRLGRPVTQDLYKVNVPEGAEDKFDIEGTKETAFKFGFSQETLDKVMVYRAAEIAADEASAEAADKLAYEDAERIVVAQAGEALEDQKILANRLIAEHVPEKTTLPDGTIIDGQQYQENLLEALNDNSLRPWVFNFLANIHRDVYGQHGGAPAGDGSAPGAMTVGMLEAKAAELETTAGYLNGEMKNTNPTGYNRLTQEITSIYTRIEKANKAAS